MNHIEVMKLALEALQADQQDMVADKDGHMVFRVDVAITALRQAIEQAEKQEPVATMWQHGETGRTRITTPDSITDCDARWFKVSDLYTAPPPRQPLTDEEVDYMWRVATMKPGLTLPMVRSFARAIEAAHGIKEKA